MALVVYTGGNSIGVGTDDIDESSTNGFHAGDRFVGLANQGATCYLNGLIQTLFMTPDFRKAVFSWQYDAAKDGSEDLCIPLQLQKLFGQLHMKKLRVVDTVALTKSFGWEGFEVFQQQDVQELTRVLFDALEESFRGTPVENVIDELYAGELIDYLRCIDVDYQSERIDKFLDFSLAIVPFGSTTPMKTLTECIEMFLRPEILDGENKYYAEKYDRKVDAIKGLKFGKLPQIMSVQLKRFVYDFSGDYVMQKKLNDQVKFPMILDMNKYLAKRKVKKQNHQKEQGLSSSAAASVDECHGVTSTSTSSSSGSAGVDADHDCEEVPNEEFEKFLQEQMSKLKHESLQQQQQQQNVNPFATDEDYWATYNFDDPSVPPLVSVDGEVVHSIDKNVESIKEEPAAAAAEDQVIYESLTEEQIQNLVATKGEWVYELYAVLIHSGAISGGHYYAYIKELSSKKWYNFNDSSVTPITEEIVREAWGGTFKTNASSSSYYYSSAKSYQSSSNAYMLMYRKVQREIPMITEECIPSYILNMVKEEEAKQLQKQREEEELRNKLLIHILWQNKEYEIPTSRKTTYHDLLTDIWYRLELASVLTSNQKTDPETDGITSEVPPVLYDRFRLCDYNQYTKVTTDPYLYEEKSHETLNTLYFNDYKIYILEIREESEEWEVYSKDMLSFGIEEYDEETQAFLPTKMIRVPFYATVGDLRSALVTKKVITRYPKEEIRILKITMSGYSDGRGESFDDDTCRLKTDLFCYDTMKLYVERQKPRPSTTSNITDDKDAGEVVSASQPTVTNYRYSFQGTPVTEADCPSLRLYITQRNRLQLRIFYPTILEEVPEHEISLVIDSRWKVQALRERILQELQSSTLPIASRVTSIDQCRLYKQSIRGQELKDGEMSLAQAGGIYNGISIYVVAGDVTPPGMFQIQIKEFVAKNVIVGAMQLPVFPPPPPPPTLTLPPISEDPPSLSLNDLHLDNPANDIESIIDYSYSSNQGSKSEGEVRGVVKIPDIDQDEDQYYETLTAARYKRSAAFTSVNTVSDTDDDDDDNDDNCSNRGNADLTPEDDLFDGIDETNPSTHTSTPIAAMATTFAVSSSSNIPCAEATALAEVVSSEVSSYSYVSAVSDGVHSSSSNRCLDMNDITALNNKDTQRGTYFQDENVFPALQHPSNRASHGGDVAVGSVGIVTEDSTGLLTPLSDSNIATETANQLLNDADTHPPELITPSDFGERVINTCVTLDQFVVIPGLDAIKLYAKDSMMVEELRALILDALIQCHRLPIGASANRIRIRERFHSAVGKVFRDGKTLKQSNLYLTDNKSLAIEILQEEEILPVEDNGDVIVAVQKFHRSTWTMSERVEVLFPGSMSVQDISKGLSMMFEIPLDSLEALIIPRETCLLLQDLSQRAPAGNYGRVWFNPTTETRLMRFLTHDFRLTEGDVLVLQNTEEPLGILTEADKLSVKIVQAAAAKTNDAYGWSSSNVTWSDTYSTVKYPKTGGTSSGNGGGGIRIKTHKDRLKEQSNNSHASGDSAGSSEVTSPLPPLEVVNDVNMSTSSANAAIDEKEFQKQGGYELFSDLI